MNFTYLTSSTYIPLNEEFSMSFLDIEWHHFDGSITIQRFNGSRTFIMPVGVDRDEWLKQIRRFNDPT